MSSGMNTPLPLRQPDAARPVPPNLVSNNNLGAGAQKNFQQTGGSHNTQFNADTINYHGEHAPDTHPLAFRSTNGSGVRTNKDPALANLHRALPPRSRLRPPAATGRARREAVCMEQNSCTGRPGRRGVRKVSCYRVRNRSPEVWTFWVHASSAVRFDADIRKLACDAGIPGCDNPKSDAFALVYSWLCDKRNGKWMLVLDNVDNPDFLFRAPDVNEESGSNKRALRNRIAYLPPCEHGSMLITSRTREATARLTDDCNVITVEPMGEATALALLEKKLGQSGATEDMQKLAAALDYMPLALAQAGAYIKQRGRRYSVGRYLAKLEKSEKSRANLLTSVSKELRRDQEAQDSIILTWQISFDHIRVTRPSAADLLSLMSMYNYQGIPEYLLKARGSGVRPGARATSNFDGAERDSGASSSASDDEGSEANDFEDDILMLENFHFISTTFLNTAFEMHRLVQLAARVWLRSHELYREWARNSSRRRTQELGTVS
jgi:hypothetical protein